MTVRQWPSSPKIRVIAFFKMGIGCHGFGVLDKAVPIEHSHGLTADGKTVAPHLEKGDGPGRKSANVTIDCGHDILGGPSRRLNFR